jgi:hypothetical protein
LIQPQAGQLTRIAERILCSLHAIQPTLCM